MSGELTRLMTEVRSASAAFSDCSAHSTACTPSV
jgi:hypothetical protein